MSDLLEQISNFSKVFNQEVEKYFPMPNGAEKRVVEAMRYSVLNGGKRIRPFLVSETSKLFDVDPENFLRVGIALEMIHTYSLIHDDLPCMDNDDLRRGKPTCHKQFDQATAVLAGDGLLTYAFEILSHKNTNNDPRIRCQLINLLARAAGAFNGMVAGQMLDIYAETAPQSEQTDQLINNIEKMKTGMLLRYACEAGSVLGNATTEQHNALMLYSRKIGQTFQISDDILDIEGDPSLVGKNLNKDADHGKVTFVTLYGLEKAKEIAQKLTNEAIEAVSIFNERGQTLADLAQYIINRKK